MPENDSQQNDDSKEDDYDEDSPKNRAILAKKIYLEKLSFEQVARKYRGKVRYASQHSMIWAGLKFFPPGSWDGVCAGLAIEWIKNHIMGGDLLENVIQLKSLFLSGKKYKKEDAILVNKFNVFITRDSTFQYHLTDFCDSGNDYYFRYPFSDTHYGFDRYHYQIIVVNNSHVSASYVHGDGTMDFYDPGIGQANGLLSTKFFGDYLVTIYNMITKHINPKFEKEYARIHVLNFLLRGVRQRVIHRRGTF